MFIKVLYRVILFVVLLRQNIRNIYENTCESKNKNGESFKIGIHNVHENLFQIRWLTVAYSRPDNLRDILCPSKLPLHSKIQNYQKQIKAHRAEGIFLDYNPIVLEIPLTTT